MPKWVPCGAGFIEADVIRWQESVWKRTGRKKSRSIHIGDRLVIAEVLREEEEGWIHLLVRGGSVIDEQPGQKVRVIAKEEEIRRHRRTMERGKTSRLLWSDETARALLASRFLGNRRPSDHPCPNRPKPEHGWKRKKVNPARNRFS